jgi:hypothetical protein
MLALSLAAAQTTLANQTPNPSAVQYRDVRQVGQLVCGHINRPNRMGGYEGFDPFAYKSDNEWAIWMDDGFLVGTPEGVVDQAKLSREVRQPWTAENVGYMERKGAESHHAHEIAISLFRECRSGTDK